MVTEDLAMMGMSTVLLSHFLAKPPDWRLTQYRNDVRRFPSGRNPSVPSPPAHPANPVSPFSRLWYRLHIAKVVGGQLDQGIRLAFALQAKDYLIRLLLIPSSMYILRKASGTGSYR